MIYLALHNKILNKLTPYFDIIYETHTLSLIIKYVMNLLIGKMGEKRPTSTVDIFRTCRTLFAHSSSMLKIMITNTFREYCVLINYDIDSGALLKNAYVCPCTCLISRLCQVVTGLDGHWSTSMPATLHSTQGKVACASADLKDLQFAAANRP